MNLNHVFLHCTYTHETFTLKKLAAYSTTRKGAPRHAYEGTVSKMMSAKDVIVDLSDQIDLYEPHVIVSANVEKDREIISKYYDHHKALHIWLDIHQLAWPMVLNAEISKDRKLSELFALYGVTKSEGNECVMLGTLYWAMMQRYKTSLFGEEVIREAGGKALASVRKLIGI